MVKCPHCLDFIIIKKINCGIFRHGVLISNGKQIDSHANKKICDNYIKKKENIWMWKTISSNKRRRNI